MTASNAAAARAQRDLSSSANPSGTFDRTNRRRSQSSLDMSSVVPSDDVERKFYMTQDIREDEAPHLFTHSVSTDDSDEQTDAVSHDEVTVAEKTNTETATS